MDECMLLIRFLLKRLCETKAEVYVSRAVFSELSGGCSARNQSFHSRQQTSAQRPNGKTAAIAMTKRKDGNAIAARRGIKTQSK